jgi:hypothetical protein
MSVFFHVATYAPQQTGVQAALHWALLLLVVDYFVVRPKERP